jgi:hypothetical protein
MKREFGLRVAGAVIGAGLAIFLSLLNSIASAGNEGDRTSADEREIAARIAENYDCGGRRYFNENGQFYEFVPGWDYASGYWVGPISRRLVLRQAAHWRCPNRAIARYIVYGRRPHSHPQGR